MNRKVAHFILGFGALALMSTAPASATPTAGCASDLSSCNVVEGVLFNPDPDGTLGYLAISGDVVLEAPDGTVVDVFRLFNDLFDAGGGTGLGTTGFLFGIDLGDLPNPSTFSDNVQFIQQSQAFDSAGISDTQFDGNGTIYNLFTEVPEASSWGVVGMGLLLVGGLLWRRPARLNA
jgi:hypothetical protein